jgi:hypothetical protein
MNLEFNPLRFAGTRSQRESWSAQKVSQLNLPPSERVRHRRGESRRQESGQGLSARKYCAAASKVMASLGPREKGVVMQLVARKPNHSVNLTRNSVPHLPGSARYAHNALPGKRVTLPRAGYLKR